MVEKAAKIANLHDFIINEMPKQYQTTVGERGVRLSEGSVKELELLGLYHQPKYNLRRGNKCS